MARISPEIIDRVREAANIVDVISQYLNLHKRGQNFVGICPFHDDTRPSLYVSPNKEIYKCFACGAGGNVFTFLTEYDKINFVDAVKQLGDKYGVEVKLSGSDDDKDVYTKLYEIHEYAADLFQKQLFGKGKKTLDYLSERGLSVDTIKQFRIGLTFNGWEDLKNNIKSQNYPKGVIEKSGLFTKSDKGIYDRFRDRIMFPIFNQSGQIIAFGGRTLDQDEPAKYLNSPDTPIYHKSDILYGLHLSRQAIRKSATVILVEGYMDFIQLYQAGIENVVAVSGTALTERHVRQIKKFSNRAYAMYDGDQAGIDAAIRAGYLLYQGGVEPLIIDVPFGQDPDDWVKEAGADVVRKAAENARSLIDFQINAKNVTNLSSAEKSQFINDIIFEIAGMNDSVIFNSILRNIGQRLQVDEQELLQRLKKEQARQRSRQKREPVTEEPLQFSKLIQKAQLILVKLLASDDFEIRQKVRDQIDIELIGEPLLKKMVQLLLPQYSNLNHSSIIDQFETKEERELVTRILMEDTPQEDPEREISDCMLVLKAQPIKEKIKAARFDIRDLERQGKDPIQAVMEEAKLQQELRDLKQ